MDYHVPVLLQESVEGLNIDPAGIYADLTFGGGGHSRAILKRITTGRLYSFDQDPDAEAESEKIGHSQFTFVRANFRHLKRYLRLHGVKQVNGILADLGVSSHQFDVPERGFSTRFDGPLDMRMDKDAGRTAAEVLAEAPEQQLHKIFGLYGEVKNARTLAHTIVMQRARQPINTIGELKQAINQCMPRGKENKYLAQVFQALRIEVNEELVALEQMLEQAVEVLAPEGRLVIISYHSLEDRLVKNLIQKGKLEGEVEKDLFGNEIKPLDAVTRKAVLPTEEELKRNPRSRSAKLRIAKKRQSQTKSL